MVAIEVAAVVVLMSTDAGGGKSGSMMTVRVEVAVRPFWSVATKTIVSVATADVSRTMLLTRVPLRTVWCPG